MDTDLRPQGPARLQELDALRGLAAIAVVLFHFTAQFDDLHGFAHPPLLKLALGNYGVQLFFVISGFVIYMTLDKTRTAADFAVSRFSRLFPAFWAALFITTFAIYTRGLPDMRLPLDEWALNLTMMPKMFAADFLDGSYWTLEVELVFYVQMLVFWQLGWLRVPERVVAAWLAIAYASGLLRDAGHPLSFHTDQLLIPAHIPYFAMGVLFFRMQREGVTPHRIALVGACLLTVHLTLPATYLWIGLGTAVLFALFLGGWLRWLCNPVLAALGAISYPLYLVHQQVGTILLYELEQRGWDGNASVAAAIALSVVLAYAVHRLVEKPALAAIRTAWKRRQAPVARPA